MSNTSERTGGFAPSAVAAARDLIDKHWDGKLPVDVVQIATSAGIRVRTHTFEDDTVVECGLYDSRPIILISERVWKHERIRARFAIAHSLGHVMLHAADLKPLAVQIPPPNSPTQGVRL